MLNGPFSPWPSFTEEDANAVRDVVLSNKVNYWTGSHCRNFEKEFASWSDSQYAIALGNGTLALNIALIAMGIGAGDEVVVTPRTFIASISTVVTVGATPVFADIDRDTQNIEAHTIEPVITPRTKAIIVVHLAGRPAEMDAIMALAEKHKLFVIEDCAQAHGAKYKGRSVGSIGHVGAWSFCQDKIMTTGGEGGMVTTNDESLWRKMWSFKDHGKSFEAVYERDHPPGFRWLHESFGSNWRMTEMQAALGRLQLKKMPGWSTVRKHNAEAITSALEGFDVVQVPSIPSYMEHANYKHYCFVQFEHLASSWSRDRIIDEVVERGVPCFEGACSEVYLERAFDDTNFRPAEPLPNAKELGETSLMFLVHPTLKESEISKTCDVIREVLARAQK